VIDLLYAPAYYMAARPERALAVAAAFAGLTVLLRASRRRHPTIADRPALLCTALWLFWGINEHAAKLYGWRVRADIVFLWPILASVTVGCVLMVVASLRRPRGSGPREDATPQETPPR
jgi:hypothetical protein